MDEIWKTVINYDGYYEVSNYGNVRSVERQVETNVGYHYNLKSRQLKPGKNKYGYLQVGLSINGKSHSWYVHSLVAQSFIPNPENKPTVNHKDGIKTNNYVDNLEWATKSEQTIHAIDNNLRTMPNVWIGKYGSKHGAAKKVLQYTKTNNFVCEHNSIIEATNKLRLSRGAITQVLKGRRLSAGGFIWKYSPDFL